MPPMPTINYFWLVSPTLTYLPTLLRGALNLRCMHVCIIVPIHLGPCQIHLLRLVLCRPARCNQNSFLLMGSEHSANLTLSMLG